ncbi:hypothetical protein CU098_002929 [Rhizopus stolonifer]|uniref:Wax synthase domain-containing protein n=1 Tax=Rhizopus stolonifer TaxID=4846 RepID=A0A367KM21_RHIST|nr:hypothetical protein CU098_002929 [Rhizopus stolonifer]
MFDIFAGGENRIILPSYVYPLLLVAPSILLAAIVAIPNNKLPSWVKQCLSVPLLLAVFLIPFGFTNGNKVFDLTASVTSYNLFLRHLELYWIGPLIQGKPVYASLESLWIEFWSCLCTFPEKNKQDKAKAYAKDKKFYHILFYLLIHLFITDLLANWATSFTGQEIVIMEQERPVTYFIYVLTCIIVLNSAFNVIGYSLQLFYCLCFEHGSWSSEQWRPLMKNPILANSLNDLWSHRWHQLFKTTWLTLPFRPVRLLLMRLLTKLIKNPKPIAFMAASLSVFVASAFMHEYAVAANLGWRLYSRVFKGEQCIFFIGHGIAVIIEQFIKTMLIPSQLKRSSWMQLSGHVWTAAVGYVSFYYIAHGFLSWGFQFDNPITFMQPYIKHYVYAHPILHSYFGSRF